MQGIDGGTRRWRIRGSRPGSKVAEILIRVGGWFLVGKSCISVRHSRHHSREQRQWRHALHNPGRFCYSRVNQILMEIDMWCGRVISLFRRHFKDVTLGVTVGDRAEIERHLVERLRLESSVVDPGHPMWGNFWKIVHGLLIPVVVRMDEFGMRVDGWEWRMSMECRFQPIMHPKESLLPESEGLYAEGSVISVHRPEAIAPTANTVLTNSWKLL